MMIAQQLYEGRRAAGRRAPSASSPTCEPIRRACPSRRSPKCASYIGRKFGPDFVPEKPNVYKTKSDAQDAHEAIRPTSMQYDPESVRAQLTPDQFYLYRLIWNRFVASQMPPATFDETTVDINARSYTFRVKGSVPKFAGWLAVYNQETVEAKTEGPGPDAVSADDEDGSGMLPPMREGDDAAAARAEARAEVHAAAAALQRGDAGQGARRERHRPAEHLRLDHQRHPGARLREQDREALQADDARPDAGRSAASPAFDDILDVEYTRNLEEDLDKIEEGTSNYTKTLGSFYKKFEKDLKRASKEMINLKEGVEPDPPVACDKCGKPMVIKAGKFGLFLACSGYPECENTRELETPNLAPTARASTRRARTAASRWR